jgi:DNA mismatch repair protein MutS
MTPANKFGPEAIRSMRQAGDSTQTRQHCSEWIGANRSFGRSGKNGIQGEVCMNVLYDRRRSSEFKSVLFGYADVPDVDEASEPEFFSDLNLDQVVDATVAGRKEYNLNPFFYTKLHDVDAIEFRQEVIRELQNASLRKSIDAFAARMRQMRENLARCKKLHYQYQKEAVFLDTIEDYLDATSSLAAELSKLTLRSQGMVDFRNYITNYANGQEVAAMRSELEAVRDGLASIRYTIVIRDDNFTVRPYRGEPDYSKKVMDIFAKFRQHAPKDYRVEFREYPEMNHIEAKVLEFVAELNPEAFERMDNFCRRYQFFEDDTVLRFDREVQFYLAYLDYIEPLRSAGLPFCFPVVSDQGKDVNVQNGFDLALAKKLVGEDTRVVCNDFYLEGPQRIFVVSGPNQGGKTTFARMFGQLHFLANLGLPVPSEKAQLYLFDALFTHFERREDIKNLRGKLQDDLVRIHGILEQATADSIVIINEIFTSTTLQDAQYLSRRIIGRILALDALCVCVTFLSELSTLSSQTVSMVSTVEPDNPARRTYKVLRLPAEGRSYAMVIAEKYGVTYRGLMERIP